MKVNVENMLRLTGNDAGGAFRHALPKLATNLRELRDRHRVGDGIAALKEFFRVYVFSDERPAPQHTSSQSIVNAARIGLEHHQGGCLVRIGYGPPSVEGQCERSPNGQHDPNSNRECVFCGSYPVKL
jgi:hypothetical protein